MLPALAIALDGAIHQKGARVRMRSVTIVNLPNINLGQLQIILSSSKNCCNPKLAASYLIRKLENEGYRIPEDVSVVGFDSVHPHLPADKTSF